MKKENKASEKLAKGLMKVYVDVIKKSERIPEWAIKKQNRMNFSENHLTMTFVNGEDMISFMEKVSNLNESIVKIQKVVEWENVVKSLSEDKEKLGENFLRGIVKGIIFYIVNGQIINVSVGLNANFEVWRTTVEILESTKESV